MPRLLVPWFLAVAFALAAIVRVQAQPAPVAPTTAQPAGRILVVRVAGEVFAVNPSDGLRFPVRNGTLLVEGQTITTGPGASVLFVLSNGATVSLGADSVLALEQFSQQPFAQAFTMSAAVAEPSMSSTRLNLVRGELISDVKKLNKAANSSFSIKTPVGAAGIRGTAFQLTFRPQGDRANYSLVMLEGAIEQTFGSRSRPVQVLQGKQLVVNSIPFNPATGEITSLPTVGEPTDIPAALQASLFRLVQQMLAAVSAITISGTSVEDGVAGQAGAGGGSTIQAAAQGEASPGISASPGPQVPPARTSPTDGQPRG